MFLTLTANFCFCDNKILKSCELNIIQVLIFCKTCFSVDQPDTQNRAALNQNLVMLECLYKNKNCNGYTLNSVWL